MTSKSVLDILKDIDPCDLFESITINWGEVPIEKYVHSPNAGELVRVSLDYDPSTHPGDPQQYEDWHSLYNRKIGHHSSYCTKETEKSDSSKSIFIPLFVTKHMY
jgi:hypothetical protein